MAMGIEIMVASALSGINILLLAGLTAVWFRNYQTFRTPLVLGLIAFGSVMLLENATAIYFFFSTRMLYSGDPTVQTAVAVLRGMQLVALVFLAWVTAQ